MRCQQTLSIGLTLLLVISVDGLSAAEDEVLVKTYSRASGSVTGTLVKEDEASITVHDIESDRKVQIDKDEVLRIERGITLNDAARSAGVETIAAWKISQLAEEEKPVGKIARVAAQTVYVTLGDSNGLTVDQELSVYRNKGEIVDPDSGEVLAVERPLIAKLQVTEVNESFSKAKLSGALEVELEVGDEVEPSGSELVVAVFPVPLDDGTLTNVGSEIAERVTTLLVQRGVKVVERSVLDKVLTEMALQQTALFDEKMTQALGEMTSATHVLTGKIVPSRRLGTSYLRLVEVRSGEIVFGVESSVSLANASVISKGMSAKGSSSSTPQRSLSTTRSSNDSVVLGKSRVLPSFLTTTGRYERVPGKGIVLAGFTENNPRGTTTVRTKAYDLMTKDFTFQAKVSFEPGHKIAYIGLGGGKPDSSYNGYTDSIYLRFHSPEHGDGLVDVTGFRKGHDTLGKVPHGGSHTVTIVKKEESVTFHVDPESDGPSEDDLELTIPDIKAYAPFLNSKNAPVFFGGSGIYEEASLTVGEAIYPGEAN